MTRDDSSISSISSIASSNLASSIQPISLNSTASVKDETFKITKKATKLVTKLLNTSAASVETANKSLTDALKDIEINDDDQKIVDDKNINAEITNVANHTLNDSLKETSDLLDLLTNEEQYRRKRIDETFGNDYDGGDHHQEFPSSKIRPKSAMVRPETTFPNSRSKTTCLLTKVSDTSNNKKSSSSSKSPSKRNSFSISSNNNSFSQLSFLPRRPNSSRSSIISSSKSNVSQALIKQTLSHPTQNKNYSFDTLRVKEIERENMRLYKNLLKINKKSVSSTGFNNKSPVKATHKPKSNNIIGSSRKKSENFNFAASGDISSTNKKKKKQRTSSRPASAASNMSMRSNVSMRSNASTTTLNKRPVTAAQLNRERDRDRIEKDNLRLYSRLQQVKPTLVTRY